MDQLFALTQPVLSPPPVHPRPLGYLTSSSAPVLQKELLSLRNQLRDVQDRLESGGGGAGHDETETETETTAGSELDDLLAAQRRINQLTTRCDQLTRERNQLIKQVSQRHNHLLK